MARITPPDVAVELNVLAGPRRASRIDRECRKAKAELVEGMKPGGTAVLNADDPRVLAMRSLTKGRMITFGIDDPDADVRAENITFEGFGDTAFDL